MRQTFVPNTLPNFHFISDYQVALDSSLTWVGLSQTFIVPKGYISDFATIPKFLWWLFGPTGKYTAAAILHDWLCTQLSMKQSPVTAREVDAIFRRRCKELGVDYVSRRLLWTGVRWGALFNERRRAGWWRDAPAVMYWSAVAFAPVLVACVGILVAYLWIGVLRAVAQVVRLT